MHDRIPTAPFPFGLFSMVLLGLSLNPTALAQDADSASDTTRLEDLVVTAQFREQAPTDVPIAVTAIDQRFMDETGIERLDQLSAFVPGLLIQEQSVNNPGFVIRGITSDDGASTIEPRVSVFQNGVSISRSRGSNVPLFDLERVEVLKGPQGTLFGRSAQIGAVHILTRRADYTTEFDARAEFGNFSQQRFDLAFNTPLASDSAALRIAATHRSRDGFIDNVTGSDLNGVDTTAFRTSLRIDASDRVRLDFIGHFVKDDAPGTSFKSGVIPALGGTTHPNRFASLNTFGGLIGGRDLGTEREIHDLTAIVDWDLSPEWQITSTTAWREFDSFETFDPDGSAFDLFLFAEDADGEQFSTDLRLNFEPNDRLSAFLGGGLFFEEGSQRVPLGYDASLAGALFNSLAAQGPVVNGQALLFGNPLLSQAFLTGNPAVLEQALLAAGIPTGLFQQEQFTNFAYNRSWDLFADLSYAFTDRLTLTGGLRYTKDRKETLFSSGVEVDNPFVGNLLVPEIPQRVSSDDDPTVDSSFDGFAWRVIAAYELAAGQSAYFNYARGRRPEVIEDVAGEFNEALGVPVVFDVVPDETVDSFEIGYKSLLMNNRLRFDVAAFYYDYENFQTTISVDAGPGVPPDLQLINAGTASSYGLETQVQWRATDFLTVFASYAYNKSRFDDEDGQGNPLLFGGNRFRLSPDHTAALALSYSQPIGPGVFYMTPSITYQSKVFFEDDNQGDYAVIDPNTGSVVFNVPEVGQEGYALVNLRAGYEMMNGQLAIEAFVNNLTDKEFIIDAGNTGATFGIPTYIAGAPRLYGVGLTLRY